MSHLEILFMLAALLGSLLIVLVAFPLRIWHNLNGSLARAFILFLGLCFVSIGIIPLDKGVLARYCPPIALVVSIWAFIKSRTFYVRPKLQKDAKTP